MICQEFWPGCPKSNSQPWSSAPPRPALSWLHRLLTGPVPAYCLLLLEQAWLPAMPTPSISFLRFRLIQTWTRQRTDLWFVDRSARCSPCPSLHAVWFPELPCWPGAWTCSRAPWASSTFSCTPSATPHSRGSASPTHGWGRSWGLFPLHGLDRRYGQSGCWELLGGNRTTRRMRRKCLQVRSQVRPVCGGSAHILRRCRAWAPTRLAQETQPHQQVPPSPNTRSFPPLHRGQTIFISF